MGAFFAEPLLMSLLIGACEPRPSFFPQFQYFRVQNIVMFAILLEREVMTPSAVIVTL